MELAPTSKALGRDMEQLAESRKRVLASLDTHLISWESKYQRRGGKTTWIDSLDDLIEVLAGSSAKRIDFELSWMLPELQLLIERFSGKHAGSSRDERILVLEGRCLVSGTGMVLSRLPKSLEGYSRIFIIVGLEAVVAHANELAGIMKAEQELPEKYVLIGSDSYDNIPIEVFILDNGRSDLLADQDLSQALRCISCGKCALSDDESSTKPSAVIRKVLDPYLIQGDVRLANQVQMPLYPGIDERCPIHIPLSQLALSVRNQAAFSGKGGLEFGWKAWKKAMQSRKIMNLSAFGSGPLKVLLKAAAPVYKEGLPRSASETFNQAWARTRPKTAESSKLPDLPKGKLWIKDNSGHSQ